MTQILRPTDHRLDQPMMGIRVRTHRRRYTEWAERGQHIVELYDYHSDPGEFTNFERQPDEKLNVLIRELQKMLHRKASAVTPGSPFNQKRH